MTSRSRRRCAVPPCLLALVAALLLLPMGASAASPAAVPEDGPLPTISVDEIERGMKGYGLTVFAGEEPQRFEAEVIGVMRNTAPETSYILARLTGHGLEESGVPGGMSGSPVYIDGRLAGAVAFAWPFSQEAIAGITPIEQMRELTRLDDGEGAGGGSGGTRTAAVQPPLPLADVLAGKIPEDLLERELSRLVPELTTGAVPGVQWAASGFGPRSLGILERSLSGVVPLGVAAPTGDGGPGPEELTHGGAVAAVMVDGDLRLAATGTVTDLHGQDVLAFGHPFLGLGPLSIPMATAEVVTVLASDYSSFKISNMGRIVGAFQQDRQPGIYGRIGSEAEMLPVTVTVDGRTFRMRVAKVSQLAPSLLAASVVGAVESASYTSGLQGVDVTTRFRIAGHDDLVAHQSFDGEGAAARGASFVLSFAGFLMGNDLAELDLEGVEVEISQVDRPRTATLVGAHAQRTVVRPGETVTLNLDFSVWRGEDFRRRVQVEVPHDVPQGKYYLFVGDGASVDAARLAVEPTEPVNIRQALELMRQLHSRRQLVVLGVAAGRGLAVAGETMPNLPGTLRSIWSAAPSGSATPLRLAITQQQVEEVDVPLSGLVRVDLEVERREPLKASAGADGSSGSDGGGGGEGGNGGGGTPGASSTTTTGGAGGR